MVTYSAAVIVAALAVVVLVWRFFATVDLRASSRPAGMSPSTATCGGILLN